MTTNIRTGVFETNSSSSHSITLCISPVSSMDKIPLTEDGEARIYPGEFGWGISDHNDAPTKASYCLVHAMSTLPRETIEMDDNGDSDEPPKPPHATQAELKLPLVQMLERVIKRGTKCEQVKFVPDSGYDRWGYIDHQSTDVPYTVFTDEDTLFRFIFNPRSELHIDNDNH